MRQQDEYYPSPQQGWCAFNITVVNYGAAFFHLIQCIISVAILAWLESKPLHSKFLATKKTNWFINTTTNQNYSVDTWTNSSIDFLNKKSGVFPIHRTINVWHKIDTKVNADVWEMSKIRAMSSDYYIEQRDLQSGEIDVRYIIVTFFALSGAFQFIEGYFFEFQFTPRLRFIEYSITASIMILAIAVESGIRDLYTLQMMFVLTWVTQLLGMLADALSVLSEKMTYSIENEPIFLVLGSWSWVFPHIAAWATCISAYAPILYSFFESNKASDTKAPGFVNVIVNLQLGLFTCFGFAQLYSLVKRTYIINDQQNYQSLYRSSKSQQLQDLAINVERIYILLSFTAKTLLAWLILSPIITDAVS